MAIKFYDRKTKKFYIRIPKLLHIGPLNRIPSKKEITDEEKIKISEEVDKIEYFGTEFGAKTIISTSDYDIFKIRDEVKNSKTLTNKANINKIKIKQFSSGLDIIRKQLGIND